MITVEPPCRRGMLPEILFLSTMNIGWDKISSRRPCLWFACIRCIRQWRIRGYVDSKGPLREVDCQPTKRESERDSKFSFSLAFSRLCWLWVLWQEEGRQSLNTLISSEFASVLLILNDIQSF